MDRRNFLKLIPIGSLGILLRPLYTESPTKEAIEKIRDNSCLHNAHPYVSLDWRGFHLFANHSDNVIGICGCGRSKNGLPDDTTIALPTLDVCQALVAVEDSVYWIGKHDLLRLDWHYGDVRSFSASLLSANGPFHLALSKT